MAVSAVTMEDIVRPNGVEGLSHWLETVYDEETDTVVPSKLFFWVRFLRDAQKLSVERVGPIGDGAIMDAMREVFDAAKVVAEGQGLKPGDEGYPEMGDVKAMWAAACALATDPTKTAADLVALLASKDWGRLILKRAYGL